MTGSARKILFFVLLLAVTYLAYRYMIKPANEDINRRKKALEAKMQKLSEIEKATAAAKSLTKQLDELSEAIGFFESKLPPTSEIHKVLEQVTVIAQKQGLSPKTIRTVKSKDNSGYVEQPLKMQLVGNFNAFYSYLLQLEELPRIMKIRELELKKQDEINGTISASFVVSIFFQGKTS